MFKLSVLVTFYNQEEYVDRAIESIFNQKVNFDFHVVVGDDGSSDNTVERVKKWVAKYPDRIQIVIQPREADKKYLSGERASNNRLSLLKYVQGEYFIYLDGDDCYTDNCKFQKQVDVLDDPQNKDCSCCAHNVSYVRTNGNSEVLKTGFKKSGKINFGYYWWKGYFHPDSIMFRTKEICQKKDCFVNPLFNDNYITYIFGHTGKIFFLTDSMASYFETDNGIWHGNSRTIGLMRTITIYDYIAYIYHEHRFIDYLRSIPLYYLLLKNSEDLRKEKLIPYFEIAENCHSKKVSCLKNATKGSVQIRKIIYTILYVLNASLKRIL